MYTTSDTPLATSLLTYGFILVKIEKETKTRFKFIFDENTGGEYTVDAIVTAHYSKKLPVDALTYFLNYKLLNKRIHDKRLEGKGIS